MAMHPTTNPDVIINSGYQQNPISSEYFMFKQRMKTYPNEKKAYEFLLDFAGTDSLSAAVERNDLTSVKQLIKNGRKS